MWNKVFRDHSVTACMLSLSASNKKFIEFCSRPALLAATDLPECALAVYCVQKPAESDQGRTPHTSTIKIYQC